MTSITYNVTRRIAALGSDPRLVHPVRGVGRVIREP